MAEKLVGAEDMAADLRAVLTDSTPAEESAPATESTATTVEPSVAPDHAVIGAKAEEQEEKTADKSAERPRDSHGKFAKTKDEAPAPAVEAKPAQQTPTPAPEKPAEVQRAELRPPTSWKPPEREKWNQVPPEIQQTIHRRERETWIAMQKAAETSKAVAPIQEAIQPFQDIFRAEGVDTATGLRNLMGSVERLQRGSPASKAQVVAAIIKTYGVPVDVLAQVLDGQPVQDGAPQQIDPRQLIAQAKEEFAREFAQTREKAALERESANVIEFSQKAEFIDDVRETMADLLEVAAKRGLALTLQEAYDRACLMDPEISKVVHQRQQAATASTSATQRARAASSSVRSTPAGSRPQSANGVGSIEDDVRASMAELTR